VKVVFSWHAFGELSVGDLYEILSLRQRVFVVEQHCAYQDADGLDRISFHLRGRSASGTLAAYLRLIPPGARFAGPSIGRVVTAPEVRRTGIGRKLMEEGIRRSSEVYPGSALSVSAQTYLEAYYSSLGFVRSGTPHDEDGIEHVVMVRAPGVR
jgi:ElaA protein